jgi:hypothetical protein
MDYKTRRYKEGLSGHKPSSIYFDKEGHRAEAAGYRAHLRNRDLAEQIYERARTDSSSDEGTPAKPLLPWQKVLWFCIAIFLVYIDFTIASFLSNAIGGSWLAFFLFLCVLPGYILLALAFVLMQTVFEKGDDS